jgi:hypothetical protein
MYSMISLWATKAISRTKFLTSAILRISSFSAIFCGGNYPLTVGIQLPRKRWIPKLTPEGYSYRVWGVAMPVRVPPHWLNCSFYVYKTVADAKAGTETGGTGCLVGWPSAHEGWIHLDAVTNRHVIDKEFGVLRLNTQDGKTSTIETHWGDWETLDESGDVAVMPLELGAQFRWKPILLREFLSPETLQDFNIWPGDEAFLIGRLMNQAGRQKNTPVVRFGNLAMLADPEEPIDMVPYGEHEAFLVECRSLSGFSGSPVFLTTTQTLHAVDGKLPSGRIYTGDGPMIHLNQSSEEFSTGESGSRNSVLWQDGTFGPWFIGIDRGHVPLWGKVREPNGDQTAQGYKVEHNTGMAVVIPAWKIVDVLRKDELVKQRKKDDEEIARKKITSSVADVASGEIFTQADFEDALKKASRKSSGQK